MKRAFQLILKLAFAAAILALLLQKAESAKIWAQMKALGPAVLVAGLLMVMVAHVICTQRMRFFLHTIGATLKWRYALKLYFVGALFNLVLPTGVGGDAVKAWALRRRHEMPLAPIIRALILDRASGLYVLCLIVLAGGVAYSPNTMITVLAWLGFPAVTLAYFILASHFFGQRMRDGVGALWYSAVSQGLWSLLIYILSAALGDSGAGGAYIVLYAAGSIVSLLPVSIGGLGLREMTFFYGSAWLTHYAHIAVNGERAIAISLAYFAVYVVSTFAGPAVVYGAAAQEGS